MLTATLRRRSFLIGLYRSKWFGCVSPSIRSCRDTRRLCGLNLIVYDVVCILFCVAAGEVRAGPMAEVHAAGPGLVSGLTYKPSKMSHILTYLHTTYSISVLCVRGVQRQRQIGIIFFSHGNPMGMSLWEWIDHNSGMGICTRE